MKFRKRYIGLTVVLIITGVVWHASLHQPTGPAKGVAIQGIEFISPPDNPKENDTNSQPIVPVEVRKKTTTTGFRIGTFNIHSCKGLDGRRDVDRVATYLNNLDFVALNEVQGSTFLEKQDQAALLGQKLHMAWLFSPSVRQWYCLESGNGLLTRVPVRSWQRIPLVRKVDYSYRNAVRVDLQITGEPNERIVHVLLTHVNRRYDCEREAQLKDVISMFLELPQPAILLGDLNSTAKAPQIRHLMALPDVIDAVGHVLGAKDKNRIDWIFVRGLNCIDAGIVENDASDHPLIWVELD